MIAVSQFVCVGWRGGVFLLAPVHVCVVHFHHTDVGCDGLFSVIISPALQSALLS